MAAEVELFEDLDAAGRDAAGALDREAQPCLFSRLSWFRLIADHVPPPGRPMVLRGAGNSSRLWLFLAAQGRRARAYAAWYSLRVGPIGSGGDDVMAALARALTASGIAELELSPLADPEPLRRALDAAGWRCAVAEKTGSWIAHVGGLDFDAWWARRPGKLRSTVKRRARAADLDIAIFDRFDATAWMAYEEVYRESWKPEEGSFGFLRALAEQEGAAGTLRLGIARRDGEPVAAQLWTVENGTAIIHKLAYKEAAKAHSPGTLLSVAMFRHAIDIDRVATIDYGTGDEPYKADWMDERRPLWRLTAWNMRTLAGLLLTGRAAASALVRRRRTG